VARKTSPCVLFSLGIVAGLVTHGTSFLAVRVVSCRRGLASYGYGDGPTVETLQLHDAHET